MILSITGLIGSGKDTFADYLVKKHKFTRLSFASSLKDAVSAIFGWDRTMLEGLTKAARDEREKIDTWWAKRLDIPHLSPRWVLQYFGTEVCRKSFHEDIWNASLERVLFNRKANIIISDARYPNELAMIKRNGGKCICIKRWDDPDWYDAAVRYNKYTEADRSNLYMAKDHLLGSNPISLGIHISEWAWAGYNFDANISNSEDLSYLYFQIDSLISNLKK